MCRIIVRHMKKEPDGHAFLGYSFGAYVKIVIFSSFKEDHGAMREIVQVCYNWVIHSFSSSWEVLIDCLEHSFEAQTGGEWLFLDTNGAVELDSGYTIAGGVAWDKHGDWVVGYHWHLGKCSIFYAELWGIFERLKLIQRKGHDQVIIQFDNLKVVKTILGSNSTVSNPTLIRRIQSILAQENQWFLLYILREQIKLRIIWLKNFNRGRQIAGV